MSSAVPQIGFDRFIRLDWVAAAIKVRAGIAGIEQLNELLDAAGIAKEAKAKTRTKLNALGIEPRTDLVEFIDRGVSIFKEADKIGETAVFAWGAAIATYPFFGKVAEFTGRLTSIQGDCSVSEIHRRMSEVYGDREITKRATQAVIQTQANWGAIERTNNGRRLILKPKTIVHGQEAVAWLVEACVRYACRPLDLMLLETLPFFYPFSLTEPLAYTVARSCHLEMRSDVVGSQIVDIKIASLA